MNLTQQINNDIKQSIKLKEKDKLQALRAIKAQILLVKTEGGKSTELSEEKGVAILQKMVKQRKESAELYKQQGRNDLYEIEIAEVNFIMPYLPEQISDNELDNIISVIISSQNATSMKDMGRVMGMASKKLQGKADGKTIAIKVKALLNKN